VSGAALATRAQAGTASPPSFGQRVLCRLCGLHRDDRGQILPLVFFLGFAFFSGVILVANVGRTTSRRIEGQVAIDAAALSAATVNARGMNYIASNNVTMAKILASIVILRAFDPAIGMSNGILYAWYGVAKGLQAMQAVPYVGPALYAAGMVLEGVVGVECVILKALRKIINPIRNFWDGKPDQQNDAAYIATASIPGPQTQFGNCPEADKNDSGMDSGMGSDAQDEAGKGGFSKLASSRLGKALFGTCVGRKLSAAEPNAKGNDQDPGGPKSGLGWQILKVLNHVGLALNVWTPVQAQMTAKAMFKQNLAEQRPNDGCWLLPIYPRLPICRAGFSKFAPQVQVYVEGFIDVIKIPGWALLTLAMFPLTYKASATAEMTRMFDAVDTTAQPPDNPALKEVQDLQEEQADLGEDMKDAQNKKAYYEKKLKEEKEGDNDPNTVAYYQGQIDYWQGRIDEIKAKIDANNARINKLVSESSNETGGSGFKADMNETPTGNNNKKQKALRPFLIDGKTWPTGFTYTALGWRDVPPAILTRGFGKAAIKMPSALHVLDDAVGRNFLYACGRVYNPSRADMWTPDWRSKLVRAELRFFPLPPFGRLPASCGCTMIPEVEISLKFDIDFIPNWDIDWPFEWPDLDPNFWLLLPKLNVPTSLGKH
jgi:hypothetical protein